MAFLKGVRFRKQIGIAPGVKVNLSKSGVSTSLGGHGATMNIGTKTRSVTLGIPGTGLSYRVPLTMPILLAVVALVVVVGLVFLRKPDLIRPLLHLWQPKLF